MRPLMLLLTLPSLLLACDQVEPASDDTGAAELFGDVPLAPPPNPAVLETTPVVVGRQLTLRASQFPPNATVNFYVSGNVTAPGVCPPAIAPTCLDIANRLISLGSATTNAQGVAIRTITVPANAPANVEFQAYATRQGTFYLTNGVLRPAYQPGADADGDGLSNGDELTLGTAIDRADTDYDGLDDGDELTYGTDPFDADTDGDGLEDGDEIAAGTDPFLMDTDGDTYTDGWEVHIYQTNPLSRDTDGDGLDDNEEFIWGADPLVADTDGGGLNDGDEVALGLDPADPSDDGGSATCGDALVEGGESCDDGNLNNNDNCPADCIFSVEVEPNNTGAEALANPAYPVSFVAEAAIDPLGDADYFAITIPAYADIRLETFEEDGVTCASIDTLVDLIAPDGTTVLVADDDDGAGTCSLVNPSIDAAARHLAPGTYFARVRYYGDGDTAAYTLVVTHPALCGDGAVTGSEQCDGTANCDATCRRIPTCGDGFTDAPETCDDGNTNSGDGCSSTCQVEGIISEVEPNNSTADADSRATIEQVRYAATTTISGAITDVTDEKDFFRVNVATPTVIGFEVFAGAGTLDCDATTSTLRLFDAAGTQVLSDNTSGIRSCSAITYPFPAGTWYVQVEETGTNANIASYRLGGRYFPSAGMEIEPNDSLATAVLIDPNKSVFGDHSNETDIDMYAVILAAPASLRIELVEGDRAVETCESNGIDSYLRLYNAAGTQLATDDDDGRGFCSLIDGTGTTKLDAAAGNLPAGTYYIAVEKSSFASGAAGQFNYNLSVTAR